MEHGRKFALLLAMLWLAPPSLAEMNIERGLWEFAIRYEFIGIPQHFPEYVRQQCVDSINPVPAISRPGQECVDTLQGRFGEQTVTWQLNCSTEWEMVNGMGRMYYDGDKGEGDVHLQVVNPYNPPQPMLFHIQGKRIGDCEKRSDR